MEITRKKTHTENKQTQYGQIKQVKWSVIEQEMYYFG